MRASRIGVFMTSDDEAEFASVLVEADPSIAFIDGDRWETAVPPARASILDCASRFVYVWSRRLTPTLDVRARIDGSYDGPAAGQVLQIERSTAQDDEIRSGSIALAARNEGAVAARLSALAMTALGRAAPVRAETLAGAAARQYRIGRHAATWYLADPGPVWRREDPGRRLRDRSVEIYFRPTDTGRTASAG